MVIETAVGTVVPGPTGVVTGTVGNMKLRLLPAFTVIPVIVDGGVRVTLPSESGALPAGGDGGDVGAGTGAKKQGPIGDMIVVIPVGCMFKPTMFATTALNTIFAITVAASSAFPD